MLLNSISVRVRRNWQHMALKKASYIRTTYVFQRSYAMVYGQQALFQRRNHWLYIHTVLIGHGGADSKLAVVADSRVVNFEQILTQQEVRFSYNTRDFMYLINSIFLTWGDLSLKKQPNTSINIIAVDAIFIKSSASDFKTRG